MIVSADKIEFNLTIKKSVDKNRPSEFNYSPRRNEDFKPDYEVYEQLDFKGLSAVEVIRKLLDYINK